MQLIKLLVVGAGVTVRNSRVHSDTLMEPIRFLGLKEGWSSRIKQTEVQLIVVVG